MMSRFTKSADVRSVTIRKLFGMRRRVELQSLRSAFRIFPGLVVTSDEKSVCGDGMRKPLIEWCKTNRGKHLIRKAHFGRQIWVCQVTGKRPRGVGDCLQRGT